MRDSVRFAWRKKRQLSGTHCRETWLPAISSGINAKRKCVSIYKYIYFSLRGAGGEAALMSHERGAVHCPLVLKMPPSRAVICVCLLLIIHSSLHTMRGLSLPLSLSLRCAAS